MTRRLGRRSGSSCAAALVLALWADRSRAHDWPLTDVNADHPIGTSFGEPRLSEDGSECFQHTGVDILGLPGLDDSLEPDSGATGVRVTVAGIATRLEDFHFDSYGAEYLNNVAEVTATDGKRYKYLHLEFGSFSPEFRDAYEDHLEVPAGQEVAKLVRWPTCGFHHLHYEVRGAGVGAPHFDPTAGLSPAPDPEPPIIDEIHLAADDGPMSAGPWSEFVPAAAHACAPVTGDADIVASVRDRDAAGESSPATRTLWVHDLRWRVCAEGDAACLTAECEENEEDCPWRNTRPLDSLPFTWPALDSDGATRRQFSFRDPWVSMIDDCMETKLYAVATNWARFEDPAENVPDRAGKWDVGVGGAAEGTYSVTVEATDFSGGWTRARTRACVRPTGGCGVELSIRDAEDDDFVIPYLGPKWWESPDIRLNPGTADADEVRSGASNSIEVVVRNTGSCALAVGETYDVCVAWAPPSAYIPYPLDASAHLIECLPETVPTGGFAIGAARTTIFDWNPGAAFDDTALDHVCLVASVRHDQDPPLETSPAVRWDDNRAQQNVTFAQTGLGVSPGAIGFADFWIHPDRRLSDRMIEIRFPGPPRTPHPRHARLWIEGSAEVRSVMGGVAEPARALAGCPQHGERSRWCAKLSPIAVDLADSEAIRVALGKVGRSTRARLELAADAPVDRTDRTQRPAGRVLDVHVVEHARLRHSPHRHEIGGLTLRFPR